MPSILTDPVKPALSMYEFTGYDLEALGLRVQTDQPVQAGFVKLAKDMRQLRVVNITIVPNPYSVPGPRALEVTRLRLRDFASTDRVPEFAAASEIKAILDDERDESKRVFFGYNFIEFDEQMVRFALFRNLIYPYLTTGKNSRRLDLFPAFQYLHFVRPGLVLPGVDDEGKLSWRLSNVMKANGLDAEGAHDAVADIIFTADLLRIFSDKARDVLEQMIELSDKAAMTQAVEARMLGARYMMRFTHYGMPEVAPVAPMAFMSGRSKVLALDLSVPPREWLDLTAQELADQTFKPGSPLRSIKLNNSPILLSHEDPTLSAAQQRDGYRTDHETYALRAEMARRPEVVARFREAARLIEASGKERFAQTKPVAEANLYDGFMPNEDRKVCEEFHAAETWEERSVIAKRLTDPRLQSLANRLIAVHAPEQCQTIETYSALREQYELRLSDAEGLDQHVQTLAFARGELTQLEDAELRDEIAKGLDDWELRAEQEIERLNAAIVALEGAPASSITPV